MSVADRSWPVPRRCSRIRVIVGFNGTANAKQIAYVPAAAIAKLVG